MSILNKIEAAYNNKFPFVGFRKPNETNTTLYIQNDEFLYYSESIEENGFIFAPFDNRNKSILIPIKKSEIFNEEIIIDSEFYSSQNSIENNSDKESKQKHIELVKKGIDSIKKGKHQKIVLSRKEELTLTNFNFISSFKKLLAAYPTAMVYVWFHPKVGLWLGATPETLIKVEDGKFETMSLAGTQVYQENITWQQKEIDEQQFVTDYIVNNLKPITQKLTTSDTNTIKAGKLAHLQTKINGYHNNNVLEIVNALHPTPAVCGLPKGSSKDFILNNENYTRTFYTGYLGEININKQSNLFVNLRCMEIENQTAKIYVGGGITKDSNPEKEWLETVAKTSTMKKVI